MTAFKIVGYNKVHLYTCTRFLFCTRGGAHRCGAGTLSFLSPFAGLTDSSQNYNHGQVAEPVYAALSRESCHGKYTSLIFVDQA